MKKYLLILDYHEKYGSFDLYQRNTTTTGVKINCYVPYEQVIGNSFYTFTADEINKIDALNGFKDNPSVVMYGIDLDQFMTQFEAL